MSVPTALAKLPWAASANFLGLEAELAAWEQARGVVLPVPYESTTSYGGGTRFGPEAVLRASRYVELYDEELGFEPATCGIATLPALALPVRGPEAAVAALEAAFDEILDAAASRFVVTVGGEHGLTPALVRVHARRLAASGQELSVLQLDAHADLRDSYEGSPHSHACAMARCADVARVVGVGIRSLSREEAQRLDEDRERHVAVFAHEIGRDPNWMDRVFASLRSPVYVTVDVDVFDPAFMPATGTPEPGGLSWTQVTSLLREVFRRFDVVGADVVELAPLPGFHAADFAVAKLVYKLFGYRFAASG